MVTDAFMQAVVDDAPWALTARTDGRVVKTVQARALWGQIAGAAWTCADPGIQFGSTINAWHTCPTDEEIRGCNPCQAAFAPVLTPDGIRTIGEIDVGSVIWSGKQWTKVKHKIATGNKPVYVYHTTAGRVICTAEHRVFQRSERIEAQHADAIDVTCGPPLIPGDPLDPQDVMDGLVLGDGSYRSDIKGGVHVLAIGEKDGCYRDSEVAALITGTAPKYNYCSWKVKTTLGPLPRTYERMVPERFYQGGETKVRGFLRGLYSANGSVVGQGARGRVTLKASSFAVIAAVQEMLSGIGIRSYYTTNKANEVEFANGTYLCKQSYDLNITGGAEKFATFIGFIHPYKTERLREVVEARAHITSPCPKTTYEVREVEALGTMPVFDIEVEADEHSYWSGGHLISNCCMRGDMLVDTSEGRVRIDELQRRSDLGEAFLPAVECFDVASQSYVLRPCLRAWKSGESDKLVEITTDQGIGIVCTPEHRFLLHSGTYVEAQDLEIGARLRTRAHGGDECVRSVRRYATVSPVAVYDLEVEGVHNFAVSGSEAGRSVIVHNSEYQFIDDTACNLASINLAKFVNPAKERGFDFDAFDDAVRLWTIVLDISVSMAGYPTPTIARKSMLYRTLGLGYAALGEELVLLKLGYGTEGGRAFTSEITSLLTAIAYRTSADLARRLGPYPRFAANRASALHVLEKHAKAARERGIVNAELWETVIAQAREHGLRNAQVSLLAPCGTIGIVMDCETTGVEPYFSDTTYKALAGGGHMKLVSKRFGATLKAHGYDPENCTQRAWTAEDGRVQEYVWVDPPEQLKDVLVCADDLTPAQHIAMMAAIQPFLSGSISKTINAPSSATVDDVAEMHMLAWRSGLKSIAIYRDGCKPAQPLQGRKPRPDVPVYQSLEEAERVLAEEPQGLTDKALWANVNAAKRAALRVSAKGGGAFIDELNRARIVGVPTPVPATREGRAGRGERREPPKKDAAGHRDTFNLNGHTFHLMSTEYPDGSLAEVFVVSPRTGSAVSGWVNAWSKTFSLALQHGTPLDTLIDSMRGLEFEPAGFDEGRPVSSVVDCIARILEARYLLKDDAPETEGTDEDDEDIPRIVYEQHGKDGEVAYFYGDDLVTKLEYSPPAKPTGNTCAACGSLNLKPSGSCFVCGSCGATTGCS